MSERKMAEYLDHAVLKPEMTEKEAEDAIRLGVEYGVFSVCVRPCDIELAKRLTAGSKTAVCCVLAFPHGLALSESKADEANRYIALGVAEIDMVANYAFARSGLWERFEADVRAVSSLTRPAGRILKVILESNGLTIDEIGKATEVCVRAGADFVKTSTGFNGPGATEEAVKRMLEAGAGKIRVKASGGIRDAERAKLFIGLGCDRLGVGYSSTPAICGAGGPGGAKGTGY